MQKNKRAFTLIELLIVVLIIGVLSAIAIPMYQGAVDKSHFSTLLPATKAIKNAEEAYKMANGRYTNEMSELDVSMTNGDVSYEILTPNNMSDPNVIRVTNNKLSGVRLASYLDDSPKFAGQLHCEAENGNTRAQRLCEKLLSGEELTTTDSYTAYLLDQEVDYALCDSVNRSWSTSKSKCYKDTSSRCAALDVPVLSAGEDTCGYLGKNGSSYDNKFDIGSEGVCIGTNSWSCNMDIFDNGTCWPENYHASCMQNEYKNNSTCQGNASAACIDSQFYSGSICQGNTATACSRSGFHDGSVCIANVEGTCTYRDYATSVSTFDSGAMCVGNASGTCSTGLKLNQGAICIANASGTCNTDYSLGACCCGNYCPSSAPKCAACDSQYIH
ncbi:MAG: pilin [Elusimicrobiaceae bacterium]|nr:pilin [Elusimicrobiaceae bacterium]